MALIITVSGWEINHCLFCTFQWKNTEDFSDEQKQICHLLIAVQVITFCPDK